MTTPSPVTDEAVDAAINADAEWMAQTRQVVFVSPSRDQVRVMLEAAAPLLTAPAEARLAEVRETAETFRRHHGVLTPQAEALWHAVMQVLDRDKSGSEGESR